MNIMKPKIQLLLLTTLAGVLFLVNLGGYDLWPPDEPRFAQVAREMMQTGDYLVPRVNGLPYKEKPPLLFWAQALLAIPFGDVTEVPARLPSALAGIATVLLTYLLVTKLYDRRTAFWAALILTTTQRFWWQARFGQIDMLLAACLTAAFLFFWLWHMERLDRYLVGFYLSIAAGVFAKGPPAVIFPILMALTFFWKRKQERKQMHLIFGMAVVVFLIAAWLVPARVAVSVESASGAGGSIASNLFRQTIGRFFLGVSHANPPWYYVLNLPVDLFPWSLFLPWTVVWVWQRRKSSQGMRFLLSWILPAFVFFSICIGKRAIYLLPLYPAFAALLARSILDLMDGERERWRRWTGVAWGSVLILLGVAPWSLLFIEYADSWSNSLVALSLFGLLCGAYSLWTISRGASRRLAQQIAVQSSALLLCVAVVGFPLINPHKSAKGFCEPLRTLSRAGVKYDLYSLGFSREEYIYYAEHSHETVPNGVLQVEGMQDLDALEQAALQAKALRTIQKAVEDVAINSISSPSDEDIQLLRSALEESVLAPLEDGRTIRGFETAITALLDDLMRAMAAQAPAFIITQERDWRWMLALCPDARDLFVVEDQKVGSRHVLLIANSSAKSLMTKSN